MVFGRYPTDASGYELLREVGHGATATVWAGRAKGCGEYVAVKMFFLDHMKKDKVGSPAKRHHGCSSLPFPLKVHMPPAATARSVDEPQHARFVSTASVVSCTGPGGARGADDALAATSSHPTGAGALPGVRLKSFLEKSKHCSLICLECLTWVQHFQHGEHSRRSRGCMLMPW